MIYLVHGIGDHIGRYEYVAESLTGSGYTLAGFDLRGHGLSTGQRGYTPSYEKYLDDISQFIYETSSRYKGMPVFLYGHSMGGAMVLYYTLKRKPDVKGVISTSPHIKLAFQPPAWKIILAKLANKIWPELSQKTGLETDALSRIPEVVKAYREDNLTHGFITPGTFIGMEMAAAEILKNGVGISCPVLIMHGADDRITSAKASEQAAEKIGRNCTFKLWERFYHELHNDPGKEHVLNYIIKWLAERI